MLGLLLNGRLRKYMIGWISLVFTKNGTSTPRRTCKRHERRSTADGAKSARRKRAMQLCADKESPLDIMFANMIFWHHQSKNLGAKLDAICGKIKNEDDRREAMSLARMFLSARENAQRCAVDCAPYVHAKLQAVHHEHGPTGRYIISDKPMTEQEWIAARADVIDVTPEKDDQQS